AHRGRPTTCHERSCTNGLFSREAERMSRIKSRFEQQEEDRIRRRKLVNSAFTILVMLVGAFLVWKLKSLLIPILVGALLAYLFRPLKDRFQVSWLPHELRVLCLFACIGLAIFLVASTVRQHVPDEKESLELKVRIKYKLNAKFQEIVGQAGPERRS